MYHRLCIYLKPLLVKSINLFCNERERESERERVRGREDPVRHVQRETTKRTRRVTKVLLHLFRGEEASTYISNNTKYISIILGRINITNNTNSNSNTNDNNKYIKTERKEEYKNQKRNGRR